MKLRAQYYPTASRRRVGYSTCPHAVIELTHNWDPRRTPRQRLRFAVAVSAVPVLRSLKGSGGKVTREEPHEFGARDLFFDDPTATRIEFIHRA